MNEIFLVFTKINDDTCLPVTTFIKEEDAKWLVDDCNKTLLSKVFDYVKIRLWESKETVIGHYEAQDSKVN